MQQTELTYTLKEIFKPTATKLIVSVALAIAWHFYVLESAVREAGTEGLSASRDFWLTNFVDALPYLETDSKTLKFVTFFAASYALVWVVSQVFHLFDNAQSAIVKRLRRNS